MLLNWENKKLFKISKNFVIAELQDCNLDLVQIEFLPIKIDLEYILLVIFNPVMVELSNLRMEILNGSNRKY